MGVIHEGSESGKLVVAQQRGGVQYPLVFQHHVEEIHPLPALGAALVILGAGQGALDPGIDDHHADLVEG
jgi:hypothetical protein